METFPQVWVTLRTLGSPGMRGEKGGGSGTSGYVDFCQQRAPRAKQALCATLNTALLPTQAQVSEQGIHTASASCVLLDPVHICRHCLPPKCSPGNCYLLSPIVETQFPHCLGEWSCVVKSGLLGESVVLGSYIIQFPVSTYSGNVSLKEYVISV